MTQAYNHSPRDLIHLACPNFYMYEIFKSDTAARAEIDNTAGFDVEKLQRAQYLVLNILQPLRNIYGPIHISSWYRCSALEEVICQKSYHRWCDRYSYSYYNPTNWILYFSKKEHPLGGTIDFEMPGVISNVALYELLKHDPAYSPFYDRMLAEYLDPDDDIAGWIHLSTTGDLEADRGIAEARH